MYALEDPNFQFKGDEPNLIVGSWKDIQFPTTPIVREPMSLQKYVDIVKDKIGLEVGGPSPLFRGFGGATPVSIPLYYYTSKVDGVNVKTETPCDRLLKKGSANYRYYHECAPGYQYVEDATSLSAISSTYDFALCCRCLEYISNPLKALKEMHRILKSDGYLILVTEVKDFTADHKRPITSFDHILKDYEEDISEKDLAHLPEVMMTYDLTKDTEKRNQDLFALDTARNNETRMMRHHLFDASLIEACLKYVGFQCLDCQTLVDAHVLVLAQKTKQIA